MLHIQGVDFCIEEEYLLLRKLGGRCLIKRHRLVVVVQYQGIASHTGNVGGAFALRRSASC